MAKTPEENALAAVARAVADEQKAQDKFDAAFEKYQATGTALGRAAKTTKWTASHPDLPDDFDLAAFRAELDKPFDEPESDTEENQEESPLAPIGGVSPELEGEAVEIDPNQLEVPDDASELDVDDPFGDDELASVEPPTPTRRRKER